MSSASPRRSFPHRFIILVLSGVLLPILEASSEVTTTNVTGSIVTSSHEVKVRVNHTLNITFSYATASSSTPLVLAFHSSPTGVISSIPNRILSEVESGLFNVTVDGKSTGKALLNISVNDSASIDVSKAYAVITVYHFEWLDVLSDVVGWIYFLAWSVSFYPQIYENWTRKSVIGLNFDFLSLNIVGFALYSLFNIGLLCIPSIQAAYFVEHPQGVNPVQLNDLIFSLHAVIACIFTIFQCYIYQRGGQSVSKACRSIHGGIVLLLVIILILSLANVLTWLSFLYICSYVKLFITLIKYVPQAYMNYRRKSTLGWSIGNVLLDFTGGLLSMAQMFIISYNNDDWGSIFGDPTKFGLGLFSVAFDILFILQHYVFYRSGNPHMELINDADVSTQMEEDNTSLQSN